MFKELYSHLKSNSYPEDLLTDKKILMHFFEFLLIKIKGKSISKKVLKIIFFLLKKFIKNEIISFNHDCIIKKIIENLEGRKSNKKPAEKKFSVFNQLILP